jgi:mxaJ protein
MFSHCLRWSALMFFFSVLRIAAADGDVLRVCADPGNLPFSNHAQEGFENRIAVLLARDLGRTPEFVWDEGVCDVQVGVPTQTGQWETTHPYYRSTYAIVSRARQNPEIKSLDDERLASMRIGIPVVGKDYAPPALVLAQHGLSAHITGFSLREPRKIIEALDRGDIDIAIEWGPVAGYFAKPTEFLVTPVRPAQFQGIPFTYEISVGVRRGNPQLRDQLNLSLARQCVAIQSILDEYRVPQISEGKPRCESSQPVSASSR